MADEAGGKEDIGKKCAHSGATIKRVRRYYRNGKYYRNKSAFRAHMKKLKSESAEAAASAAPDEGGKDKKE